MYMILRLNGLYNSNSFQDIAYQLNSVLRGLQLDQYRTAFNRLLEDWMKERLAVPKLGSLLEFGRFNQQRYATFETRPLRYLLARVEKYLCDGLGREMTTSVKDIACLRGVKKGFHVEHILSRNPESEAKFSSEDEFDDQRDRLGGLLLLNGRTNESSGNELYADKLKTYSNGLEWGRTLVAETYHHSNKQLSDFNADFKARHDGVGFEPISDFDKEALERRSRLLYEIVRDIWEIDF